MKGKVTIAAMGLMLLAPISPVFAGVQEEALINKIVEAYGGDALLSTPRIEITEFKKTLWPGQEGKPGHADFFRENSILTIDFEGERKSMLSWRVSRSGKDLDRFVFDGRRGRVYDLPNKKYEEDDWYDFGTIGRSVTGASDTMIARTLPTLAANARAEGEAWFEGRLHDTLTVTPPGGGAFTLYVDKASGLISKKVREHPRAGEIAQVFSAHDKVDGVAFARDMNLYVGGKVRAVSVERDIDLSPSLDGLFEEPEGFSSWGEVFDNSAPVIREVAKGVYHVGQGRSYSLFVDAGDHFIAAGGEGDLGAKLAQVQAYSGRDKPLGYMIITHPHSEHIGAVAEAVSMGAVIVAARMHAAAIRESLPAGTPAEQIISVDGDASLGGGAVRLFDIATAHSNAYLLVHLPAHGLLFGEDHFETQLRTAVPRVHQDMVNFRHAVDALGIDVTHLLDGHSQRMLTVAELRAATDAFTKVACPDGFRICAKG